MKRDYEQLALFSDQARARAVRATREELEKLALSAATLDGFTNWLLDVMSYVPLTDETKVAFDAIVDLRKRLVEQDRTSSDVIKNTWE